MTVADYAEISPPKKATTKRGLTIMMLILFMVFIPTSASKVARDGMIVLEKMKMIPAAMEFKTTDINMIPSK